MALGVLAASVSSYTTTGSGTSSTVVYTCPAGISHAVVHVYGTFTASVQGATGSTTKVALAVNGSWVGNSSTATSTGGAPFLFGSPASAAASVILSPGDTISAKYSYNVAAGGTAIGYWDIAVTGYEVP